MADVFELHPSKNKSSISSHLKRVQQEHLEHLISTKCSVPGTTSEKPGIEDFAVTRKLKRDERIVSDSSYLFSGSLIRKFSELGFLRLWNENEAVGLSEMLN